MTRLPAAHEKPSFVAAMFSRIARRYDVMNTLMTLGQDALWRRAVADAVRLPDAGSALDVGTGTGRLARAVSERFFGSQVIGIDFTLPMMRAARSRRMVDFAAADALRLPFGNERFDAVVSAFLLRNLADVEAGLDEQVRVLRPGGRLLVLETTPGPPGVLRPIFRLYFRGVVPILGALVAGDAAAYTYLPESTAAFSEPERLASLLRARGLVDVRVQRMALGSVAITSGAKPA
jgi:demethylmenaquinone methyltransferase / 2-methoxy-6-polyprenyl-1,4-benzoquinol methylase